MTAVPLPRGGLVSLDEPSPVLDLCGLGSEDALDRWAPTLPEGVLLPRRPAPAEPGG